MKRLFILLFIISFFYTFYWYQNRGLRLISTAITGPLGQYFRVVDRDYSINDDVTHIELKCIKIMSQKNLSKDSFSARKELIFILEIKDRKGNTISKSYCNSSEKENEFNVLESLAIGESSTLPFKAESYGFFNIGSTIQMKENEDGLNSIFFLSEKANSAYDRILSFLERIITIFALF